MAGPTAVAVLAGVLVIVCILHEPTLRGALPDQDHANVPGLPSPSALVTMPTVVRGHTALLVLTGVVAGLGASPWFVLVPAVLWAAAVAVVVIGGMRGAARQSADERRRAALDAWGPQLVLHFSGPADATHQVLMWLPYLQRVDRPFLVIVRERPAFEALTPTGVPVVLAPSLTSLEACVVDSMRAAFYVNNGMKNTHLVRFSHLTHVQLLHGDSEKPPSYSPVTAMYDKVFVAGRAGRDRYRTHGVEIPDDKFVIVGRPQVESIATGPRPRAGSDPPTVLYAPTWRGQYEDSNYCSLPIGATIVSTLLDAGARVVFRPHPFSVSDPVSAEQIARIEELLQEHRRSGGPDHLFGTRASEPEIIEVYNLADAMVADLSSVVSDYLFSGRPFAVTNMHDDGDFASRYPIVAAAYPVSSDASGVARAMGADARAGPAARRSAAGPGVLPRTLPGRGLRRRVRRCGARRRRGRSGRQPDRARRGGARRGDDRARRARDLRGGRSRSPRPAGQPSARRPAE